MEQTFDYVIVGARCAGSATALQLARAGAKVLLIDRAPEIGDTLSTHALMRPAIMLLDQWDLIDQVAAVSPSVNATHFHYGKDTVTVDIDPFGRAEGLYAPRRSHLDGILLNAAAAAGADVRLGVSCESLKSNADGRVTGAVLRGADGIIREVNAGLVIGADGRTSAIADLVGADTRRHSSSRNSVLYGYYEGLENRGYRWYFSEDLVGGLIPTSEGAHCAFIAGAPTRMKDLLQDGGDVAMATGLGIWDLDVAEHLATFGPLERYRRCIGAPGHIKACAGDGWALVGDAGYFKDPCTAHGITDALLDAHRLTSALMATPYDARSYQSGRDHYCDAIFDVTQEIAGMNWSMERLQALHRTFSRAVKAEIDGMLPERLAAA